MHKARVMDKQQKVNCRRCLQVLLPTVPGPVIEYALNSPLFASIMTGCSPVHVKPASCDSGPIRASFTSRAMDSDDFDDLGWPEWGFMQLGGRKPFKHNNVFGDQTRLSFAFKD